MEKIDERQQYRKIYWDYFCTVPCIYSYCKTKLYLEPKSSKNYLLIIFTYQLLTYILRIILIHAKLSVNFIRVIMNKY